MTGPVGIISDSIELPERVTVVLAAGIVLLVVGTLVRLARRPERPLVKSLLTWWLIYSLAVVAFLSGRTGILVFLAGVSALALREYQRLAPVRPADRLPLCVVWLSVPLAYGSLELGFEAWTATCLVIVPVLLASMVLSADTEGFLRAAGIHVLGVLLCVVFVSHAAALYLLAEPRGGVAGREGWLLFLFVVTEGSDIAQAITGRALGKSRLAPGLSPGKTIAGLVGGLLFALGAGTLLGWYLLPVPVELAAAGALLVFAAGIFGDLTMSAIKRDRGVKDAGKTLPGQGGVLDRMDSLALTAPVFFWFTRLLAF
jgi:phosphatidate cytidylyltransferase